MQAGTSGAEFGAHFSGGHGVDSATSVCCSSKLYYATSTNMPLYSNAEAGVLEVQDVKVGNPNAS